MAHVPMEASANTTAGGAPQATHGRGRRAWIPLLAWAVPLVVLATTWTITAFDVDAYFPYLLPMFMVFPMAAIAALLVSLVWFFTLAGYSTRTKVIGLVVLMLVPIAWSLAVRKVEFSGMMTPIVQYRWQPERPAAATLPATPLAAASTTNTTADGANLAPRGDNATAGLSRPVNLVVGRGDFPRYRGVNADGIVPAMEIATDWTARPPRVRWRRPCGGGYAGVVVAGDGAVTLEQRGEQEAIVCYDRGTGEPRWSYGYPALFVQSEPMGGSGPRATPAIADGQVFSLGAMGDLVCVDGATGKPLWQVNILADNGAKNLEWGMTGSPLVYRDLVIVNPGIDPANSQQRGLAAYDRATGQRRWASDAFSAGYSSPQLATLGGVEQVLLFDAGGLAGFDPNDGHELWRFPWVTFSAMNIIQPVVLDAERVFISSHLAEGSALVRVTNDNGTWRVGQLWQHRKLIAGFANPVVHDGHIYGLGMRVLTCLDATTGERVWKNGRFGAGQVLLCGDKLVISSEEGELALAAASPQGFQEYGRLKLFAGRTWNTHAIAGRDCFLRNHEEIACVELPQD